MDDETPLSRDAVRVLETLERVEEKIEKLRAERDRLYEANGMLVDLVNRLEDELTSVQDEETEEMEDIEVRDYRYSFESGWQPKTGIDIQDRKPDLGEEIHPEQLVLGPDVDTEGIEEQIHEVRDALKKLGNTDG